MMNLLLPCLPASKSLNRPGASPPRCVLRYGPQAFDCCGSNGGTGVTNRVAIHEAIASKWSFLKVPRQHTPRMPPCQHAHHDVPVSAISRSMNIREAMPLRSQPLRNPRLQFIESPHGHITSLPWMCRPERGSGKQILFCRPAFSNLRNSGQLTGYTGNCNRSPDADWGYINRNTDWERPHSYGNCDVPLA